MKVMILLLMILSVDKFYAQESQEISEYFENHAFRLYGNVGYIYAGIELGLIGLNTGGGISYAYEFGRADSKHFMGVSIDTQLGAIALLGLLSFNIQTSFGVGRHYKDGGRFFFDILGFGYSLINYSSTKEVYVNYENKRESIITDTTITGFLFNVLSFHHTTSTGFYFSWRNNVMVYNRFFRSDTYESGAVENTRSKFLDFEYTTYLTFGFDLSKKYNPKIYRRRES